MRKILLLTGFVALVISSALMLTQCTKDGSSLSGTVKLDDETVAGGAIVVLSKSPGAADIIATTVADEDGVYSFSSLENGTYYVTARWEPSNNNNEEKVANSVILTGEETEISVNGELAEDLVITSGLPEGARVINLDDGWTYDNTHSTVKFEFPYNSTNSIFTGIFANTGFDALHFDQANPDQTEIKAWVDLISVETGSPGTPCGHTRDGITGCISGTFGVELDPADTADVYCTDGTLVTGFPNQTPVEYDLWGDGSATTYMKQSAVVGSSGVATIDFKEVVAYRTGYKAKADFTFNGVTHSVDLYFNFQEGYEETSNSGDTKSYISFYGTFKFAALSLFGIDSGHVGDSDVTVRISSQFNKVL